MTNDIRVVHFLGAGRSGSTLLNILLDNHPDVIGAGEVGIVPRALWLEGIPCACGQSGYECPLWSSIWKEWVSRTRQSDIAHYIWLQGQFERYRRLPRLLDPKLQNSPDFLEYADLTLKLYTAMREVSGASLIVDSSKNPVRALALSRISGIDLHPLLLTRDVRGVSWSRKRFRPNAMSTSLWRSALNWQVTNLVSELTIRYVGKSIRLRYEDIVSSPSESLSAVGNTVGIDMSGIAKLVSDGSPLRSGHVGAGNRMRRKSAIILKPDTRWLGEMPIRQQSFVWWISAWMMHKYGYKR